MNFDKAKTVGEIVADNYRAAEVFKSFGIDFCCGGGKTVAEVCQAKGVDYTALERQFLELDKQRSDAPAHNFKSWQPSFLIDYIVNVHHTYVTEKVPLLKQYAAKVAKVHKDSIPASKEVKTYLDALSEELLDHLQKEERVLFPYIKRLEAAIQQPTADRSAFKGVSGPIGQMELEHEFAGEMMSKIRAATDDFTPPDFACNTVRVLYKMLEEFERDLHQHVHLENNVLFPRALKMEAQLTA
ncbi:MAG: iron-sulfur cluster repair di-iron protein [Phaeodactylibacter xiamenensis]|uniref:Hemerythrin-like domain-containing protein n=1 Tax=Phaeodactylibacter xiamenensis TaxID=1524460 RepID=A0A098S177_9BACT|nr:iron-sulfur cluster repair di-iron protein [Phaeodactylibacter xiamenensis]KGE85860.1 hypothetical protein IX84_24925 [Phaeodactylibacter xiamenensis]MCR9053921.1 iron-sulfur cluster repair di-iron protein [bacterium]